MLGCVYGDFCLRSVADAGNPGWYHGRGKAYPDTLKKMVADTQSLQSTYHGIVVIWLIHFAPFQCKTSLQLLDWQNVIREAERLYCSGSAGSVEPVGESRVHVLEIEVKNSSVQRHNFAYKAPHQAFRYVSSD